MKNYFTIKEIDKYNACAYTPSPDKTNTVSSTKNVLIWDQIQMFPCVLQIPENSTLTEYWNIKK
jgi:hypothetical protein